MRLKLSIKNLTFDGEIEFSQADLLESPPAKPAPALPRDEPAAAPALCCDPPRREPKPKAKREPTGPLRVDTGRRSSADTLGALREHQPCGPAQLAEALGITAAAASQRLSKLMAEGRVSVVSRGVYQVIEGAE